MFTPKSNWSDRSDRSHDGSSTSQPDLIIRCSAEHQGKNTAVVQIQFRKRVLDHAEYTAPTRKHELYRTDHTDHTDRTDRTDRTDHTDRTDRTDLNHEL